MKVKESILNFKTTAGTDILDITGEVSSEVGKSDVKNGMVLVFVAGSTASVSTIEYEDGVVEDLRRTIEELVPKDRNYLHDSKWGDGNGYSHVRAAIMKPSLTVPLIKGEMHLGTWQQLVLLDFDNRPRSRKVVVHIMGE